MNWSRMLSKGIVGRLLRPIAGILELALYECPAFGFRIKYIGCGSQDLELGNDSYSNGMILMSWGGKGRLKVGSYCSIAQDVRVMIGGQHELSLIHI